MQEYHQIQTDRIIIDKEELSQLPTNEEDRETLLDVFRTLLKWSNDFEESRE